MENIYTIINTLNKVSNESVMESDKETNAKDPMQETPFSSDSVTKLLDAEQQIAGIKSELKNSMMSRLAELAGVPLAEIEEAIGETPEAAAARIKEGHCEACGCEMANPDPTCECGASGGKIMVTMDEDEVEEGNEFSGALAQAKKDGKEEFEVDGKKYKVSEADYDLSTLDGKYGNMPVKGKEGILQTNVEDDVNDIAATMEEDPELENFAMAFEKSVYASGDTSPEGIRAALEEVLPDDIAGSRIKDLMKVIEAAKPDFADIDGDGDKDEDMKKAAKDKEKMDEEFEDEKVCDKCDEKMDDCKCEKVEETTTSGAVAVDASGNGKALYKNASVYESNEIVRAAGKLMEGMNINISMNDQSGPSLTVNATDEDAMKLGALLKLAGLGNLGMQHDHVHEEQEFANGADDTATADTDTLVNGIAGGLNGPKQQVNPNNPGDNPLAMQNIKNNTVNLGESELEETSASHLMELYKEFKAK